MGITTMADQAVLNLLEQAKIQGHLDKDAVKMGKLVNKAMSVIEVEIAKAISIMKSRGDMNLTPEVIKLLTAVCVSTVMRYIDLPEDQRTFIDALHYNIESLYEYTNQIEQAAEHEPEPEQTQERGRILTL